MGGDNRDTYHEEEISIEQLHSFLPDSRHWYITDVGDEVVKLSDANRDWETAPHGKVLARRLIRYDTFVWPPIDRQEPVWTSLERGFYTMLQVDFGSGVDWYSAWEVVPVEVRPNHVVNFDHEQPTTVEKRDYYPGLHHSEYIHEAQFNRGEDDPFAAADFVLLKSLVEQGGHYRAPTQAEWDEWHLDELVASLPEQLRCLFITSPSAP